MEINSVRIQNYKSCKDVKINLKEPIMALIGKNSAGKTNTLAGIYNATKFCLARKVDKYHPAFLAEFELKDTSGKTARHLIYKFKIYGNRLLYIKDILWELKGRKKETVFRKAGKNTIKVGTKEAYLPHEISALRYQVDFTSSEAKTGGLPKYYSIPGYKRIFTDMARVMSGTLYFDNRTTPDISFFFDHQFENWKNDKTYDPGDKVLGFQFYDLLKSENDTFNEYKKIVVSLGLVEDIQFLQLPVSGDTISGQSSIIIIRFVISGNYYEFSELSDGTKKTLRLLFDFFYHKPSLMLIEEPENSIHFGLLVKVLSVLNSYTDRNTKILFSTHSEQILNIMRPEQVIYISNKDGKTKASYFTGKMLKSIKSYLSEVGPFGEYYTSGELEGDIEEG